MKDRFVSGFLAVGVLCIVLCAGVTFGQTTDVKQEKAEALSALDCESIKDNDSRHYCRAIATGKRSHCEFIKDNDLRRMCRAQTK